MKCVQTSDVGGKINNLGVVYLHQGKYVEAAEALNQAHQIFKELKFKIGLAVVINNLAKLAFEQSEYARSVAFYKQSLPLLVELDYKYEMPEAIEGMASIAGNFNQVEVATKLFGFAKSLRDAFQISVPKPNQMAYNKTLINLQEKLNETLFQKSWSEGQAMSLKEAVSLAMDFELL